MRIAFNIALVVSMLFMPWWLTALIMVAACMSIGRFYEAVLYALLIDSLYATSWGWHGFAYAWSASAIALLFVSSFVRARLKMVQ